jgi:hypothetical protein
MSSPGSPIDARYLGTLAVRIRGDRRPVRPATPRELDEPATVLQLPLEPIEAGLDPEPPEAA